MNKVAKSIELECKKIIKSFTKVSNYFTAYFDHKNKDFNKRLSNDSGSLFIKDNDNDDNDNDDDDDDEGFNDNDNEPQKKKTHKRRLIKVKDSLIGHKRKRLSSFGLSGRVSPVFCLENGLKKQGYKVRTAFMGQNIELGPYLDIVCTNERKDELHKILKTLNKDKLKSKEMILDQVNLIKDEIYKEYPPCKMYKELKSINANNVMKKNKQIIPSQCENNDKESGQIENNN